MYLRAVEAQSLLLNRANFSTNSYNMIKKILRIGGIALLILTFIGTFWFLWQKAQPKKIVYLIEKPTIETIEKKSVATGKVEPRDEVMIKPQISGIVQEIYKEAGQIVNSGDIIAKVKVIPEMSSISNAESRIRLAQIALDQYNEEFKRQEKLFQDKIIAKEEFERSKVQLDKYKEELDISKESLEVLVTGVSKRNNSFSTTLIRATVSGMILDIPVKVGNSVIQSNNFNDGTTIATLANMNDMIFRGNIDETDVGRVKDGMPIKITLGAIQNTSFKATLEYVSPKGKEENGANLFEIKAAMVIPDSVFVRAGYSANAEIVLARKEKILTIPESSIEFHKDSAFVYKLTSAKDQEQEFKRELIEVGLSDGIRIEVLKGVTDKDELRGIVMDPKKN